MTVPFNSANEYFKNIFGKRVQKISINAGFTCPNRDGTKGVGGCIYCNNDSFKPFYTLPTKSITQQLNEGIEFFSKKYQTQQYLAYFQAFTNTYAPIDVLKKKYDEALQVNNVIGLVISTRPDCFDENVAILLKDYAQKFFVLVEFGIETTNNTTLAIINRQHTYEDAKKAIELCNKYDILSGIHLIFGLPNETKEEIVQRAKEISPLPFKLLKIHHLQIIKGTKLATIYAQNPDFVKVYELDEYIDLIIEFLEYLSPDKIIDRFINEVPQEYLIAPIWGKIKNYEFVHKLTKEMNLRNSWQGKKYNTYSNQNF